MSWAVEEWKDGLPSKALQKIQEIEGQLDKLKKERQQKQFQMDSLEAALQKQKQKIDLEKNEAGVLKRENQSLVESCESLEKTRVKISHELQVKEQQVNYLEGQLSSSRKQIERLEQEMKRCKNELDRTQPCHTTDLQPCSTPQTFATPATPSQRQLDFKFGDLQEKYNKEVEERKKLESELKVMQVKLLNQSSISHKDIARQQTQSSIFPWQQEQTSSCQSSFAETPLKRKTVPPSFLWEAEETPVRHSSRSASLSQNESASSQALELLKVTNQDLKTKVSELELRVQSQEKEMKNQVFKFQEMQSQLDKAKKELNEKDKTLHKSRDELTKLSGQYDQAVTKCSSIEQKLKQVTEEMNCYRHNAESSRRALEQKVKDQEKESQKELASQQNSRLAVEQQLNQVKAKMSQELQQAKKDQSMLQSDVGKVMAQKNQLEKDLEEFKIKLCRSDQALQASQAKEMDLKKKFEEVQREKNSLSSQLEQGVKRLSEVEEEIKTVRQNLKHSNTLTEDLKGKTQAQTEERNVLQMKLDSQVRLSAEEIDNLKKMLAEVEMKTEASEKEVQKQRIEMEQMTGKNSVLEKEHQDMHLALSSKQNEYVKLKSEAERLLQWKSEKESLIDNIETEREVMLKRIGELEKTVATHNDVQSGFNEKFETLENEKATLMGQIDSLKGELLNKSVELEEKEQIYNELQKRFDEASQKHSKDLENQAVQVTLLQEQVTELGTRLQQETSKLQRMDLSHSELLIQYESACDLAKSKESVIELTQKEISHLRESLSQALTEQERQLASFKEEKCALMNEYEKNISERNEEAEQAKLNFEKSQQDMQVFNDQISSLDSALKLQKHLNMELQNKYDILSSANEDLQEKISKAKEKEERCLHEISIFSEQAKTVDSLQQQLSVITAAEEQNKRALKDVTELLNQKDKELQTLCGNTEEFKTQVKEMQIKVSNLEKENVQLQEKLKLCEKNTEELSSANQSQKEAYNVLFEEKACLLKEKAVVEDRVLTLQKQLEASSQHCSDLTSSIEALQGRYASTIELNSELESSLKEQSDKMSSFESEMKTTAEKFRADSDRHSSEIESYNNRHKTLTEELVEMKTEVKNKTEKILKLTANLENSQTEMFKLRVQITTTKEELVKVTDSYKTCNQEVGSLKEKSASYCSEIEALRATLFSAESEQNKNDCVIQSLKKSLHDAELEHNRLTHAIKEKDVTMNKIKVQLEMLQMDLEDNEVYMNSFDSKTEAFQCTINSLEAKLQESESQRSSMENELHSLKEELALKDSKLLSTKERLEEESEHEQRRSALAAEIESLQLANSKLLVAVDEEVIRNTSLEKMCKDVSEQNSKLEAKAEELQNHCCKIQEQNDGLKRENCHLKEILQIQKEECQCLKSTIEKTVEENNKTNLRNKEFEKEQIEVHQKIAVLQNEYDIFRGKYSSLLSQVAEQQSLIEQLHSEVGSGINAECKEVFKQRPSSAVNISSLSDGDCMVLESISNVTECSVLHSSGLIEDLGTESCDRHSPVSVSSPDTSIVIQQETSKAASSQLGGEELLSVDVSSSVFHEQLNSSGTDALSLQDKLQKKSELESLSQTFKEAVRSLESQTEAEQQLSKAEIDELKDSLCGVQKEMEQLQKQHSTEMENWRQKLIDVSLEMEAKLAAERQRAVTLSVELEAARLQMQGLDLSSRSVLCSENEECILQIPPEADAITSSDNKEDASSSLQVSFTAASEENLSIVTRQKDDSQKKKLEGLDENEAKLEKLQEELQAVCSQLEVCVAENTSRKNLCTEMEAKLKKTEEEKLDSINRLNSAKQKVDDQVQKLEEEVNTLKLQLHTSQCQYKDMVEMLETLQLAKGDWDDRVLQMESDLKRVQSEKANLEKHILSMEADVDEMEKKKTKLEEELEASKRTCANLEQSLNIITSEQLQLKQELLSFKEDKEAADQSLLKWKEQAKQLEKDNIDVRELNKFLEDDVRNQKRQQEIAGSDLENLRKEKSQLSTQVEVLEQTISLLSSEKDDLMKQLNDSKKQQHEVSHNLEVTVMKLQTLEAENLRMSRSLESSLLEKGEIASRLNSTQEEVTQMKVGIKKLQVRIEADERNRCQMTEMLKAAQRKAEELQDNLEKLEREKEMTEQSLEDAVLQAETAKAELEDLEAEKISFTQQVEQMNSEKKYLQEEKERLEKELLQGTDQLQRMEKEKKEETEAFQSRLNILASQLQTCQNELESMQLKEQDLACQLSSLDTENVQLSQSLQEVEKLHSEAQATNQVLGEDLRTARDELIKTREGNDKLNQQVVELHMVKKDTEEKLRVLQSEHEELERAKMHLQSTTADWEQRAQMASAKCEVMQITISSLESDVHQKEECLQAAKLSSTDLSEKIKVLNESNAKLLSELEEALKSVADLQAALEMERLALGAQRDSSEQQAESYKLSLETLTSEKEELSRSLKNAKESVQREARERDALHQELLKQLQRSEAECQAAKKELSAMEGTVGKHLAEISSLKSSKEQLNSTIKELQIKLQQCDDMKLDEKVAQLSKEKDSALGKLTLWKKSCKQLEKEKQVLLDDNEQQGALIKSLQAKGNHGRGSVSNEDLRAQIEELKEALEERTKEADDSMDKYCSLLVTLHKLEEANETLQSQVSQQNSQLASRSRRSSSKSCHKAPPSSLQGEEDERDRRASGKRQRALGPEDGVTPNMAQETLYGVAKRIRAAGTPQTTRRPAEEEEEFRPEGLPDLVKKGFADIPVGEASPFIVRRTTVRRCSPRLAARNSPLCQHIPQSPESAVQGRHKAPEASKERTAQETKVVQSPVRHTPGALASVTNSPAMLNLESPVSSAEEKRSRRSLSMKRTPEQREKRRQSMASAQAGDNCQVQ